MEMLLLLLRRLLCKYKETLFWTSFNSDGGACIKMFKVLVIRMSYSAKNFGEILWYSYFLLQKIAGGHFSQKSNLDLFYHPSAILSLVFSTFCSFLEHLQWQMDCCAWDVVFSFAATNILYSYLVLVSGKIVLLQL